VVNIATTTTPVCYNINMSSTRRKDTACDAMDMLLNIYSICYAMLLMTASVICIRTSIYMYVTHA